MDELALPFPFEVAVPRHPLPHQDSAPNIGSITTAAPSSYVDTGSLWEVPDDQPNQASTDRQSIRTAENVPEESNGVDTLVEDPEHDVDPISTIDEAPRCYVNTQPGRASILLVDPVTDPAIDVEEASRDQDDIIQGNENVHFIEHTDFPPQPEENPPQPQTVSIIESEKRHQKRAKKSQKKKVKRGKTTSAVVRRRVESDIEDDVIWVDEKKSRPAIIDDSDASDDILDLNDSDNLFVTNAPAHEAESVAEALPRIEVQVQVPTKAVDEPNGQVSLAPNKRGRKRKKTDQEDVSVEEPPRQQIEKIIPDDSLGNRIYNTPSVSQPHSSPETIKQQTPEPKVDHHNPHTSVESPENSVDKRVEPTFPAETPKKPAIKGPDKHSPIAVTAKAAYRVGLSRKARIAPLLKVVRK